MIQLNAQKNWLSDINHGVALEISRDYYSDYGGSFGNSFEGGMYFLLDYTKRKKISAEIRTGYAQTVLSYNQIVDWPRFGFFSSDTIVRKSRSGDIDYKNLQLAFPVKFRYKFNNKISGLHLTAGMIHYIKIWKKMNWKFDEFIYDGNNWPEPSRHTLIEENQEENLDINTYHFEIVGGFGYSRRKVMVDFLISGGDLYINDDFIRKLVTIQASLNLYYQLN